MHGRKDHELWRRWLALTDFPDHDDIRVHTHNFSFVVSPAPLTVIAFSVLVFVIGSSQGYIKASATVLGPNEFQASHDG